MAFLKLLRWILTALLVLALLASLGDGLFAVASTGVVVGVLLLTLWLVPHVFARERRRNIGEPVQFREGFDPDVVHDNIALDTKSDTLWIRDASGEQRYVQRGDLIAWKSAHDWNNGTFRQRLELDLKDVRRPRWHVLFQRHSDTWIKTSKRNGQERDEWFARLRAWDQEPPSYAAKAKAAGIGMSLPGLHSQYLQARSAEASHNWLVAFDVNCHAEGLDPRTEWERLGGTYPGPSPELVRMSRSD